MKNRRHFLKLSAFSAGVTMTSACATSPNPTQRAEVPKVISTWNFGQTANRKAWEILGAGGYALDAVERGVRLIEADPQEQSVGLGGLPDRDGIVTLDACIMNEKSECGSVAALEEIVHPISVARKVMEETPHVMLVGQGAQQFAVSKGFRRQNLLTPASEAKWRAWTESANYTRPEINHENHDTIGMLAIDQSGRMSGACTTSGAAWKLHGRVGDSPIIGAGLFLDQDVGGACATGLGEAVIRTAGSAMVVEAMRYGASPQAACRSVVERIVRKHSDLTNLQVGFLAMNAKGEIGAHSVFSGFSFAVKTKATDSIEEATYDRRA